MDALPYTANEDENVLEPRSSMTNQSSYLDVYLSHNSKPKRISKNVTDQLVLVSEINQLRLVFHGGTNTQNARGLRATYNFELAATCGAVFTSPLEFYHRIINGDCRMIIEVPGRKNIRLLIRTFSEGQVTIYDNSTEALLVDKHLSRDTSFNFNEPSDSSLLTIFVKSESLNMIHLIYGPTPTSKRIIRLPI